MVGDVRHDVDIGGICGDKGPGCRLSRLLVGGIPVRYTSRSVDAGKQQPGQRAGSKQTPSGVYVGAMSATMVRVKKNLSRSLPWPKKKWERPSVTVHSGPNVQMQETGVRYVDER